MSETTPPAAQTAIAKSTAPTEFACTLDEWCTHLSVGDRRVEMIGGFAYSERVAGRVRDLPSAYASRYAAFANGLSQ